MRLRLICLLIFFLTLLLSIRSYCQTDTSFWFVAPEVSVNGSEDLDRPIYLRISSFSLPSNVIVSEPANPSFAPISVSLLANASATVDLTPFIDSIENKPPNQVINRGILIRATANISVYYEVLGGLNTCNLCNPELFSLKGRNALGTQFFTPFQLTYDNSNSYVPTPYSAFDIVATQNATNVTITPAQNIVGHVAGSTFTVTLNRGQTFSCTASSESAPLHPSGSVITSDKPIAVTVKDDLINIGGQDLEGDQLIPVDKLGNEYIVVAAPSTTKDLAIIVGTQNNTQVNVNGSLVTTINTGQTYQYAMNTSKAAYINTSAPVYLYQLTTSIDEAGGAILPPIACTGSSIVSVTRSSANPFNVFLITQTGNEGNFLFNGSAGIILASNFAPVPGTSGNWQFALIDLSNTAIPNTAIRISNTTGLFSMGLLEGIAGGSSYGYFSDFSLHNTSAKKIFCYKTSGSLLPTIKAATHLWSNGSTSDSITVDTAGIYWVQNILNGCTLTDTFAVKFDTIAPVISAGPDTTICKKSAVQLSAKGNGNFSWSPSKGLNDSLIANPLARPLVTTTYIVTNNAYSCGVAQDTVVITVNLPPDISYITPDTTICKGNGILLIVNNGSNYAWSPHAGLSCTGCQTPVASPDTTTKYYITENYKGCFSKDSVTIRVKVVPFGASGDTTICYGKSAQLHATPDNSYSWNPSTGLNNSTIADPVATPSFTTTYTLTAFGYCGMQTDVVKVRVQPNPDILVSGNADICKGDSITLNVFGNPVYSWSPSAGLSCTTCQSPIASPGVTTTYSVTVTNSGCSTTDTIIIGVINPSRFKANDDTAICTGQSAQLKSSSGYSYTWIPSAGLSNDTIADPVASPVVNTTYIVTANNVCGTQMDTVVVLVETYPTITISHDTSLCKGTSVQLSAGGGSYYNWLPVAGLNDPTSSDPVATPDSSIHYTVSVFDFPACVSSASVTLNVLPYPGILLTPDITSICGESVQLSPVVTNATSFHWKSTPGLADSMQLNPIVNPDVNTTYIFIANNRECISTASEVVTLLDGYINLPTAFSPNNDGYNDIYRLVYSCEFNLEYFRIYNRWGEMVFETNQLNSGWNGKFKGNDAPVGVYQYIVSGTNRDGKKVFLKGNVTLLR